MRANRCGGHSGHTVGLAVGLAVGGSCPRSCVLWTPLALVQLLHGIRECADHLRVVHATRRNVNSHFFWVFFFLYAHTFSPLLPFCTFVLAGRDFFSLALEAEKEPVNAKHGLKKKKK